MYYNNVMKKQNGITLVALIITVILMLILAGVAISVLTEDGGLFGKTKNSADLYEQAAENENKALSNLMNKVDVYLSGLPQGEETLELGKVNTDKNMTYDKKTTGTYNNPIIPKGFAPINENGANWGTVDGYQKGLVIQDSDGNEFVWVPVPGNQDGSNINFERIDFGIGNVTYNLCTETVPMEIENSISFNEGFYIARYETGIGGVSKKDSVVWRSITWNDAKTQAESKYASNNSEYGAVSTLIYATQYDTALKFIQTYNIGEDGYATYATNSDGYGNYTGTSKGDTSTGAPAVCGELPTFRQKNIYDMAGNVYEWNMEYFNSSYQILRGGCFYEAASRYPAGARVYTDNINYSLPYIGFRMALYIK